MDDAFFDGNFRDRHTPCLGGGRHQHRPRTRRRCAQLRPRIGDGRTAARALPTVDQRVAVKFLVRRSRFHAHLRPIGIEFFGGDRGQARMNSLTVFHVLGDQRDNVIGRDAKKRIGRESCGRCI